MNNIKNIIKYKHTSEIINKLMDNVSNCIFRPVFNSMQESVYARILYIRGEVRGKVLTQG